MIYAITITNKYQYPLNDNDRDLLYIENLLCISYSVYVQRLHNISTMQEYIDLYIPNISVTIDKINSEYKYADGTIKSSTGNEIDDKTASPLLISFWDDKLQTARVNITGIIECEYNIHIVFSDKSSNAKAKKLTGLSTQFLTIHAEGTNPDIAYNAKETIPDQSNYEGIIDKIVDIYQNYKIWKFNSRLADDFIKKVESEYTSKIDYRKQLITKLFNKL